MSIPSCPPAGLLNDAYQLAYLQKLDKWSEDSQIFMQLVQSMASREIVELGPWQQAVSGLADMRARLGTAAAPSAGNSTERFGFDATTCFDALQDHIRSRVVGETAKQLITLNIFS